MRTLSMSHTLSSATLVGFVALMLAACTGPRKASERACSKAERHVAKAVWMCPAVLEVDTAVRTVDVVLPGDSVTVPVRLAHSLDVDSILAQCEQLREVIAAERDLYAAALERQHERPGPTQAPAVRRAVDALQRSTCQWEPITYEHALFTLTVAPGQSEPLITVQVKDRVAQAECPPCPPRVKVDRVVQEGVHPGWRTFGRWVIGLLSLLVLLIIAGVVWVLRNHHSG